MLNTNYRERFAKFFEKAREKRKADEEKFKELIEKRIKEKHAESEKEVSE